MFRDDDTLSPASDNPALPSLSPGSRPAAHNQRGGLGDPHQVQPEVAVGSW